MFKSITDEKMIHNSVRESIESELSLKDIATGVTPKYIQDVRKDDENENERTSTKIRETNDEPRLQAQKVDDIELGICFNKSIKYLTAFYKQICPETAAYFELMYGQVL